MICDMIRWMDMMDGLDGLMEKMKHTHTQRQSAAKGTERPTERRRCLQRERERERERERRIEEREKEGDDGSSYRIIMMMVGIPI